MKTERLVVFLLMVAALLSITLYTEGSVHAQVSGIEGCIPLSLVLIVDQSDSMTSTDASNQRLVAAREVLQRLFLNSGLNCPNVTSRVAIVEFGSQVQRIFDWVEVSVPDLRSKGWQRQLSELQAQLQSKQLGYTNFSGAFQEAAELFKQLPEDDSQRAVILVTDGLPCMVNRMGSTDHCGNPQYVNHYFNGNSFQPPNAWITDPERNGLVPGGLVAQIERDFPSRLYKLSVLYFDDLRAQAGLARNFANQAWQRLTSARSGKYIPPEALNTRENIVRELSNIMNDLLNVRVLEVRCDEPIYIEPYTSATALFTAIGPQRFLNVRILGPNGLVIADGRANAEVDFERQAELDSVTRYIIRNPTPGEWRVQGASEEACRNIQISYEAISVRATRLANTPKDERVLVNVTNPYSTPSVDGYIEIELRDSYGNLFREINGHPLEITARVTAAPSLEAKAKLDALPPIRFSEVRQGVWRSEKLLAPERVPDGGQPYRVLIEGRVKSVRPTGEFNRVFSLTAEYSTLPPAEINLVPVEPRNGAVLPLNRIEGTQSIILPFNVSARVVQAATNTPQRADLVFALRGNPEMSVYATLLRGTRTVERIPLKPSPSDPTLFVGTFRTNVSPQERDQNDVEGAYSIRFEVDPRVISEGRYNIDTYVFKQTTPDPVTVERRELFGLVIRSVSQLRPKMLINRFEGDKSLYNTLDVEAQIFDLFNNRPAATSEAFARTDNLVFARLFAPDNSELARIPLQYRASTNTFIGTFFDTPETQFDTTGIHSIRFSLESAIREGAPYQIVKAETEPQFFERVLRTGVVAQIARPRNDTTLDLNRLDGRTQVPVPFEVTVRFTDVVKNIPLDPRSAVFSAEANALQALRLEVYDADNNLFTSIPLTQAQVGSTFGEVVIRVPFEKKDFSRLRAVRFELAADQNKLGDRADPEVRFELIQEHLQPVSIQTSVISGASLQLVQLGTQTDFSSGQPSRMPLYNSIPDAFLERRTPAKVAFLILDQDDQALSLAQLGITETDSSAISERLARLIKTQVLPPEAEVPVDLSAFRIEPRLDLPPVFVTEIGAEFDKTGNYVITYRLDGTQLPRTVRPIEGSDSGSATLERFMEGVLLDPKTWTGARTVLFVLVSLFVFNLLRVNLPIALLAGHRLSGTLVVEIGSGTTSFFRLGSLHLWRNIARFSKQITVSNVPVRLHLRVLSTREAGRYTVHYKLGLPKNAPKNLVMYSNWSSVEVKRENTEDKPVVRGGLFRFYFKRQR
ncbi:MAG: vWA domain-containing protein [Anaerolineae bacterium]|nr:vWA domain-containing protein [Anaerolineae bacterium]